jgi:hypothetical protein
MSLIKELPRLFLTKRSLNKKMNKLQKSSHHRNVSTDPLGTGGGNLGNH